VHAAHDAPDLPHDEVDSEANVSHAPLVPPLQQPAQVFALHAQTPLVVSQSPLPHDVQVAPAVPHEVGVSDAQASQVPVEPPAQHPFGHEVASHAQTPVFGLHPWPALHPTAVHEDVLVPGWQL
jgi:hypothetical protein